MHFDIAVVGRGLIGSAAAKYLGQLCDQKVCIIGPDEPSISEEWTGPFSSHFDESRVTRISDRKQYWANISKRSIEAYPEIERESEISFHSPVGYLRAGPQDFLDDSIEHGHQCGAQLDIISSGNLAVRFSDLSFPSSFSGIYEHPPAGYINPRKMKAAQLACARKSGVTELVASMTSLELRKQGVHLELSDGLRISAGRVLLAMGAYTPFIDALGLKEFFTIRAEITCLGEVSIDDYQRLKLLPSCIAALEDRSQPYLYYSPAILYPNGRAYVKLGPGKELHELHNRKEINEWFHSDGDPEVFSELGECLRQLHPEVSFLGMEQKLCVLTYTNSEEPLINVVEKDRVFVGSGGNGSGAKCSDEIGRLAALKILNR